MLKSYDNKKLHKKIEFQKIKHIQFGANFENKKC